jgi:DNA-binding Lrp family transcriptional regulator
MNIDQLDRRIIQFLMKDPRISCSDIARDVGDVTPQTVGRRIRRLFASGVLKTVLDVRAFGHLVADVFIEIHPGAGREVVKHLAAMEDVCYVAISHGDYWDVSAELILVDLQHLQRFIDRIHAIEGVKKARVFLVTEWVKSIYDWELPSVLPET